MNKNNLEKLLESIHKIKTESCPKDYQDKIVSLALNAEDEIKSLITALNLVINCEIARNVFAPYDKNAFYHAEKVLGNLRDHKVRTL